MRVVEERWRQPKSHDELVSYQTRNLRAQVEHCYRDSPLYRRKFDEVGLTSGDIRTLGDIGKIPPITKAEIIASQAKDPPFGDCLAIPAADVVRIYIAPGPICHAFGADDYRALAEVMAKALARCGVRKEDVVDITPSYHWVMAGTWIDEAYRALGCAAIPGGIGERQTHVENIRLTKATILQGFPTFIEQLLEKAKEMGLEPKKDLHIRMVVFSGELRSEETRRHLAEGFGAQLRELFGTAEVGTVAYECEYGGGMHLLEDAIMEIVNPINGEPVTDGGRGEIVFTETTRRAMPFLRYKTGDLTEGLNLEPCPCGMPTPRLKRILGRVGDMPRVKGLFISPKQVERALSKFGEAGKFQIVIDRPGLSDILTIRIEWRESATDVEGLKSRVADELKAATGLRAEIELVPLGRIPEGAPLVEDHRTVT